MTSLDLTPVHSYAPARGDECMPSIVGSGPTKEPVRAKSLLKQLLPKSAGNIYRRREETRALAAIATSECDVQHLAKQSLDVVLPTPSEWTTIEERVASATRGQRGNSGDQRLITA